MKNITKLNVLSTNYRKELEKYIGNKKEYPKYESGTFRTKHYTSVYINLLACQKGVCAYSEALITKKDFLLDEFWKNGEYIGEIKTKELDGDIDHFNPKTKKTKGWEWSNLFVVMGYINKKIKGLKIINPIFKPDNIHYEPYKYMKFNFKTQLFVPLVKLEYEDVEIFEDVKNMISWLGLNSETIKSRRTEMLLRFKKDIDSGIRTIEYIEKNELSEFFTAFEMSKNYFYKNDELQ